MDRHNDSCESLTNVEKSAASKLSLEGNSAIAALPKADQRAASNSNYLPQCEFFDSAAKTHGGQKAPADKADSGVRKLADDKSTAAPDKAEAAEAKLQNASVNGYFRTLEESRLANGRALADTPSAGNNPSLHRIMDEAVKQAAGSKEALAKTGHGVYFQGRLDVDADGSPRARELDPRHGQLGTALRYDDGKVGPQKLGTPIDSEKVPYIVVPGGHYKEAGVGKGDLAIVRNRENGKMTVAVVADMGHSNKRGEGSMALASELGVNNNPMSGGSEKNNFDYLVLPQTGYRTKNQDELMARIQAQKERLGLK